MPVAQMPVEEATVLDELDLDIQFPTLLDAEKPDPEAAAATVSTYGYISMCNTCW